MINDRRKAPASVNSTAPSLLINIRRAIDKRKLSVGEGRVGAGRQPGGRRYK